MQTAEQMVALRKLFSSTKIGFCCKDENSSRKRQTREECEAARESLTGGLARSLNFLRPERGYGCGEGFPVIGKLSSGSEHVYVATGFKGWGMTNSHVAAVLLTDMISGRANPWAELFDPSRFKPITSARDFVRENLNVAKEFMADRVSTPELESLDGMPLGHGEVVEWRGERVAVYKDDQDTLYACSAVCTHMGCIVRWNSAERSWDCPCHGSRFNYDGRVIQGPANEDLEPKRLKAEAD